MKTLSLEILEKYRPQPPPPEPSRPPPICEPRHHKPPLDLQSQTDINDDPSEIKKIIHFSPALEVVEPSASLRRRLGTRVLRLGWSQGGLKLSKTFPELKKALSMCLGLSPVAMAAIVSLLRSAGLPRCRGSAGLFRRRALALGLGASVPFSTRAVRSLPLVFEELDP